MSRISVLLASIGGALLAPSFADAADFQEGRFINCAGASSCRLSFVGPGAGARLRLDHITCKVSLTTPRIFVSVDLFDNNNALYVPTVSQEQNGLIHVATAPVTFFTGGTAIAVTAHIGVTTNSQLACTITGQTL